MTDWHHDSFLTAPIFGDAEVEACFSSVALARNLARVEGALAKVQGALGVLPEESAAAISRVAEDLRAPGARLAEGVGQTGVPVPALVAELRKAVGPKHADHVHFGATSQDIVDTALARSYAGALDIIGMRLSATLDHFEAASERHRETLMIGRTRGRLATPITFGLRVAHWAQPLIALENDLPDVRRRTLKVQFGGACGSRSAVGSQGGQIAEALAKDLGLEPAPPWHTDRSGQRRLSGWLAAISAATAKVGADLVLSGRNEIAEVQAGAGGGSSTMPQKSNPVSAEAILSLSRVAMACEAGLAASSVHAEERDGGMWSAEWFLLPRLAVTTAAALRRSADLAEGLRPDVAAMTARLDISPGVLSEAAVFALSATMGRQAAQRVIAEALSDRLPLDAALKARVPEGVDWDAAFDPARFVQPALEVARRIFGARRQGGPVDDENLDST